jgi:hypothetical protein
MSNNGSVKKIMFSRQQALATLGYSLLFVPITKMVKQGITFREYYWFIFVFIICAYLFWNIYRITILMLFGRPGVVLSKRTLVITAKSYTIEWNDITSMELIVSNMKTGSYAIAMQVKDPWKYISRIKNPVLKYYRWYFKDTFNSFSIDLTLLEGDSNELYDLIRDYYHQNR